MITSTRTHQDEVPSDQVGWEAPRALPLLLSLVDQATDEQKEQDQIAGLASQVTQLVAQRLPVTAASLLGGTERASEEHAFAGQVYSALSTYLQKGFRRLLLVPWGSRQHMGSLLELARLALSTAMGESVSLTEMTLPHVHVDGISARGAFDGYISIQAQLCPLMEAFPGWDHTWAKLSVGNASIVLLCTSEWTEQLFPGAGWEMPTIKALTVALCPQHAGFMMANERSRWQRDGEIYARYLASLLCAATGFLQQEQG